MNHIILKFYVLFLLFLIPFYATANITKINICADDFRQNKELSFSKTDSINIEILKEFSKVILKKNKMEVNITLIPLLRCLDMLKKGTMDAMIRLSYTDERAKYLDYPPGSGHEEEMPCYSNYKVTCSGYVVITHVLEKFIYLGNSNNLPTPVRITSGISIENDLKEIYKENLEGGRSYYDNIKKLLRDKKGSVIASYVFPIDLVQYQKISPEIKIHEKYYVKKSYYMPFSKKSKITEKNRLVFWEKVSEFYNDNNATKKILDKYK
ncbi:MAG: hypothetical protein DCC88_02410 [Spirobacillus cienkowskii]|jgi:polar amino acid transport system substrate-binding protein|uniref:Solute-binding protein family 3/N-terminal domain-containing protein n=1 Tax=Spirobacillus cienkowskii TaxID=495820 RepID=A0A369KW88_9BACT|nr:MAG: hypothetical protein DCC88_02410 [Spirobacillus cienkowskii]